MHYAHPPTRDDAIRGRPLDGVVTALKSMSLTDLYRLAAKPPATPEMRNNGSWTESPSGVTLAGSSGSHATSATPSGGRSAEAGHGSELRVVGPPPSWADRRLSLHLLPAEASSADRVPSRRQPSDTRSHTTESHTHASMTTGQHAFSNGGQRPGEFEQAAATVALSLSITAQQNEHHGQQHMTGSRSLSHADGQTEGGPISTTSRHTDVRRRLFDAIPPIPFSLSPSSSVSYSEDLHTSSPPSSSLPREYTGKLARQALAMESSHCSDDDAPSVLHHEADYFCTHCRCRDIRLLPGHANACNPLLGSGVTSVAGSIASETTPSTASSATVEACTEISETAVYSTLGGSGHEASHSVALGHASGIDVSPSNGATSGASNTGFSVSPVRRQHVLSLYKDQLTRAEQASDDVVGFLVYAEERRERITRALDDVNDGTLACEKQLLLRAYRGCPQTRRAKLGTAALPIAHMAVLEQDESPLALYVAPPYAAQVQQPPPLGNAGGCHRFLTPTSDAARFIEWVADEVDLFEDLVFNVDSSLTDA